eukprot:1960379-Heterocapsa_arctica.AAC.1
MSAEEEAALDGAEPEHRAPRPGEDGSQSDALARAMPSPQSSTACSGRPQSAAREAESSSRTNSRKSLFAR